MILVGVLDVGEVLESAGGVVLDGVLLDDVDEAEVQDVDVRLDQVKVHWWMCWILMRCRKMSPPEPTDGPTATVDMRGSAVLEVTAASQQSQPSSQSIAFSRLQWLE